MPRALFGAFYAFFVFFRTSFSPTFPGDTSPPSLKVLIGRIFCLAVRNGPCGALRFFSFFRAPLREEDGKRMKNASTACARSRFSPLFLRLGCRPLMLLRASPHLQMMAYILPVFVSVFFLFKDSSSPDLVNLMYPVFFV